MADPRIRLGPVRGQPRDPGAPRDRKRARRAGRGRGSGAAREMAGGAAGRAAGARGEGAREAVGALGMGPRSAWPRRAGAGAVQAAEAPAMAGWEPSVAGPSSAWPRQRVAGGVAQVGVAVGSIRRTYSVGTVGHTFRIPDPEPSHNASALAARMAGKILQPGAGPAVLPGPRSPLAPPPGFGFEVTGSEDELFEAAESEGAFLSR